MEVFDFQFLSGFQFIANNVVEYRFKLSIPFRIPGLHPGPRGCTIRIPTFQFLSGFQLMMTCSCGNEMKFFQFLSGFQFTSFSPVAPPPLSSFNSFPDSRYPTPFGTVWVLQNFQFLSGFQSLINGWRHANAVFYFQFLSGFQRQTKSQV